MGHAHEQRLVEKLIPHAAIGSEAGRRSTSRITILHRPSRRDVMPLDADLAAPCQHGIAGEPDLLSLTIMPGSPRSTISFARSRTTLRPEIDVYGIAVRHSWVTSSITLSIRPPCQTPSLVVRDVQDRFGNARTGAGALVPTARLRLDRRVTASPSSL